MSNLKNQIVLGASYGNEGKGLVVDYLSNNDPNSITVRFSGNQSYHNVNYLNPSSGYSIKYGHYGAGSGRGISTYISKYAVFNPLSAFEEAKIVGAYCKLVNIPMPTLYIDSMCPIVTVHDVRKNIGNSNYGPTSTSATGYGTTMQRHFETPYKIHAIDLLDKNILTLKVATVSKFYNDSSSTSLEYLDKLFAFYPIKIVNEKEFFDEMSATHSFIFEGTHGLNLDMEFGEFPHVTRGYTTSKNAMKLIEDNYLNRETSVIYVTRIYNQRLGSNGYMATGGAEVCISPKGLEFEPEENKSHKYLGKMKFGPINIDQMKRAIQWDRNFSHNVKERKMVVTCADQIDNNAVPMIFNGKTTVHTLDQILEILQKELNLSERPLVSYEMYSENIDTIVEDKKIDLVPID